MQLLKGFPSLTDSTSQSEKEKAVLCCGSIFSSHDPVQGCGGGLEPILADTGRAAIGFYNRFLLIAV